MVKYFFSVILLFFSLRGDAQQLMLNDTDFEENVYDDYIINRIKYMYELYSQAIDPSYELINGVEYFPYYYRSITCPVLFTESRSSTSITLKGIKYEDVCLGYDTYSDEIIYIDSARFCIYCPLMVAVNKDNVNSFKLLFDGDTLSFKYLKKEEDPSFNLPDGFYEVVMEGNTGYLIRHRSILREETGNDEYIYTCTGYISTGKSFKRFKSKRQFIRIFGDKSEEINKYINNTGIKIRKADKQEIMRILKFYKNTTGSLR